MKILAIDLATTTGWAFGDKKNLTSGTISFKNQRFEGGGMRYLRFRKWLEEFIALQQPDLIAFEEIRRHMSTDAAHVHGGLLAQLQVVCDGGTPQVPYTGIPVGTIKKTATGKGNAGKEQMVTAAKAAFPDQEIADDNQADALWILRTAQRDYDK